jgi:hypothetical protein
VAQTQELKVTRLLCDGTTSIENLRHQQLGPTKPIFNKPFVVNLAANTIIFQAATPKPAKIIANDGAGFLKFLYVDDGKPEDQGSAMWGYVNIPTGKIGVTDLAFLSFSTTIYDLRCKPEPHP